MMTWTRCGLLVLALLTAGVGLTRYTTAQAAHPDGPDTAGLATTSEAGDARTVTLYKSPTCTCCGAWGDHLRENGFEVREEVTGEVAAIMEEHGVPMHLRSCHLGVVDGYVLVGHVPADLALRVLDQEPPVTGIAVPGMPLGSPGMESFGRTDRYDVIAFGPSGAEYVYETR